jgi:CheY-like chemotaxis protein
MLPDDTILIAEDIEDDAVLLERAFNLIGLSNPVKVLADGAEVIEYLRGGGRYADRAVFPFPRVLFTDLKMPHVDGFELLRWLRKHPEHAVVPTIVFSSSGEPADVRRAYELGAHAYLVKPCSMEDLQKTMRRMYEFWALCAQTPSASGKPVAKPFSLLCGMG